MAEQVAGDYFDRYDEEAERMQDIMDAWVLEAWRVGKAAFPAEYEEATRKAYGLGVGPEALKPQHAESYGAAADDDDDDDDAQQQHLLRQQQHQRRKVQQQQQERQRQQQGQPQRDADEAGVEADGRLAPQQRVKPTQQQQQQQQQEQPQQEEQEQQRQQQPPGDRRSRTGACGSCGKQGVRMKCPTCKSMGLPSSYFCDKACFAAAWSEHKLVHHQQPPPAAAAAVATPATTTAAAAAVPVASPAARNHQPATTTAAVAAAAAAAAAVGAGLARPHFARAAGNGNGTGNGSSNGHATVTATTNGTKGSTTGSNAKANGKGKGTGKRHGYDDDDRYDQYDDDQYDDDDDASAARHAYSRRKDPPGTRNVDGKGRVWIAGNFGRTHCRFGDRCVRKDCKFAHPEDWAIFAWRLKTHGSALAARE